MYREIIQFRFERNNNNNLLRLCAPLGKMQSWIKSKYPEIGAIMRYNNFTWLSLWCGMAGIWMVAEKNISIKFDFFLSFSLFHFNYYLDICIECMSLSITMGFMSKIYYLFGTDERASRWSLKCKAFDGTQSFSCEQLAHIKINPNEWFPFFFSPNNSIRQFRTETCVQPNLRFR